jgi:hypothetical protein
VAVVANITRRLFLKSTPVALAAVSAVAAPVLSQPALSPGERIDAAMAEIQAALQEMHPTWSIQAPEHDLQHVTRVQNGATSKGDAYSHAILFYAYDGKHGSQAASWFRSYR